jgi:hypothetical protein
MLCLREAAVGSISCVAVDALMPSTICVLDKWLALTMRESLEDSKGGQQDSGRQCRRHPKGCTVAVVPREPREPDPELDPRVHPQS